MLTPLTLGIETLGGIATPLIERNTTIPTKKSQVFSTAEDNQTAVDIRVVQGERKFAKDNNLLGQFRLDGIPTASRGVPQVEVTFDIDANGIVHVSAKDKATGKEQKITISNGSGLSKEDIKRMVDQAQEHEQEDKKAVETVESRNRLDSMILQIEKTLRENKEKITSTDLESTEAALEKARIALKEHSEDKAALESATDELMKASHAVAEKLYKQNAETKPESSESHTTQAEEEPIDTEINQ